VKAYLAITGVLFALIVVAHIARLAEEGTALLRDPWWVVLTIVAGAMSVWAWRLFAQTRR